MTAEMQPMFTVDDWLRFEARSELRHELVDGRLVAMGGCSGRHSQIATRIIRQLAASPCEIYNSDAAVLIAASGQIRYPDLSVVCGDATFDPTGRLLLNPTVLVEVLSETTWQIDEGEKLPEYQTVPSVQAIVLVDADGHAARLFRRGEGWRSEHVTALTLECGTIDFTAL